MIPASFFLLPLKVLCMRGNPIMISVFLEGVGGIQRVISRAIVQCTPFSYVKHVGETLSLK